VNPPGMKVMGAAIGVLVVVLAGALWWSHDFSFGWNAPPPGTVLAQSLAPDSALIARVRAGTTKGQYVFELRRPHADGPVVSKVISAPVGYHKHIVSLRWGPGSSRAIATIDHDFGVGNLEFALAP